MPPGVKQVKLNISVAGNRVEQTYAPTPNQQVAYTWDGLDAYGRAVQGKHQATVTVSYVYDAVYYASPADFQQSFALTSGQPTTITRVGSEIGLGQTSTLDLKVGSPDGESVAGWSMSDHHRWDATRGVLVRGDGTETGADAFGTVITTVAGGGSPPDGIGDGGLATAAALNQPRGIDVAADGSLYMADFLSGRIRRVGPDGMITTVAGGGHGFYGDGGPAIAALLNYPTGVAVAADGSVYIADQRNHRIRRVGADGIITTVAGNGNAGFSGDGGPATAATLYHPYGVAVGADGSLYIADYENHRIRRVGPDDIITTVAGNGCGDADWPDYCKPVDGVPATASPVFWPYSVAVGVDGSLFITDRYTWGGRIRRVGTDGIITTVAADVSAYSVAVAPSGSVYLNDASTRISRVAPSGVVSTVAGNGTAGFSGDEGPAAVASLQATYGGVAVGADGNLYIADTENNRIRRVASTTGFNSLFVPSADGAEVYEFDTSGRHLRTLDALSGGIRYIFGYDSEFRLISIADGSGNLTRIERNGVGEPTAIVSPDAQRTELTLDPSGYLASIANPAGEMYRMQYTADGLLTRFEDPRGNASTLTYDALGRLVQDANAAAGSQNLVQARLEGPPGTLVTVTTAEGPTTAYRVEDLPIGSQQRTVTAPDGTKTVSVTGTDATTTRTGPDGTLSMLTRGPDPRFGMSAPVTTSQTVTTPAGLTATLGTVRTASLTDPNDPLTLTTLTDTVTLNGRTSTSVYDAATRTTTSTSTAGRQSTAQVDLLGRPTHAEAPGLAPVNFAYDDRGRLASIAQGSGADARAVTLTYDAAGNLASVTDPLGRSAGFAYDLAGRVTRQTFPDGREVLFDYDAKGNLTSLAPPGRPAHTFNYTPVDLTAEYVPPDVGAGTNSTRYSYNRDKQLTQVLRPDGVAVDLTYDSAGRLASLAIPEGAYAYGYNAASGNLSQIAAPGGTALDFSYDGSLLTGAASTGAVAGSVGFAYDNDFRVSSVAVNGGDPVAYQYDADSLLIGAGDLTLTRDAQNGLLTGSGLGVVTDSWGYNGFAEPASYSAVQNGSPLLEVAYTRDKLGRIVEKTETVGGTSVTYAYGYDLAGRLVEVRKGGVVQTTWGYDANGNRTHVNGVEIAHYDAQDRLLDYAGATYTYTANGELKTKTVGPQVTTYSYDALGNLRQVSLPDGTVIDYLIDGRNRRIGKKVNGTLVQGFLYQDQLKPVAELDGAGNVVSRFVYATHANVPDYIIKDSKTYRIVTDQLGSPRLVVDTATGAVVQRMEYDAWGNVLTDTNAGFQPFGFAGGLYDADTRQVRFGTRDYDAQAGRWITQDPVKFRGQDANLYRYAKGDPINFRDLFGLRVWSWDEAKAKRNEAAFDLLRRDRASGFLHAFDLFRGGGTYDFKTNNPNDFFIYGEGETQICMTAGEFGNYVVGFATRVAFGRVGTLATRAGGHVFAALEYVGARLLVTFTGQPAIEDLPIYFLDDSLSTTWINQGIRDAVGGVGGGALW